ncbi:5'-nucleotidase, lipoprotein e(P4) family [Bacillus methanolicus]|uniref:5'-nucleotidase, lipoprotein e(P4) family n=1 Tax=Bacillus methanolicus TaxID=1471 RepID=UPI00200BD76F|nr:5'-nucleotidase, lipoprotein e(P4) family [Bacillus methanolicus]UQD53360.1 5'-nucleotidase, lipoprotein e(P4) family [Bacillus methanolicus]
MKKITTFFTIMIFSLMLISVNANAMQEASGPACDLQKQNTMSVLWFQTSGEAKALFHQGYNIGKMRLDEILAKKPKNPAVVLDLDETVLDNSPYFAWTVKNGNRNREKWYKWMNRAEAKALPGAVEFLTYANSRGVKIFYISNRREAQKEATIKNLQQIGAPQANSEHVLLKQPGEKGKETRRQHVARTHNIVLLFGDNLGDFSGFDQLSAKERVQNVEKRKDEFGKKLIVFPNPMYGDWERAIYHNNFGISNTEKAKLREESLQPFMP